MSFFQDIRFGVRRLLHEPGFTAVLRLDRDEVESAIYVPYRAKLMGAYAILARAGDCLAGIINTGAVTSAAIDIVLIGIHGPESGGPRQ